MFTERGDGVACIKRRRRDLSSNGVKYLVTTSGRGRLKDDLESSTWRRRQDLKATPSQFAHRDDEVVFRMPQRTKELDLVSPLEKDKFEAFFVENLKVFSIWKAFGGKTRDLGSFGEETEKSTDPHQHLLRISTQKLEMASRITHDAVTTHLKTVSQDLKTASDCTIQPII
ncbi:hypothetical protein Tco_0808542 [Tanacetum coccineum]